MFWSRGAKGARRMMVATWNIRHGAGLDGKVDLERIAATLQEIRADLIGLQELDRGWERSGGVDQPARLAELTGMEVAFRPTVADGEREYGLAVASSRPIEADWAGLPRAQREEPRGVLVARTHGVTALVTHLSRNETSRRRQLERLAEIAALADPPVLVLGDLNEGRRGLRALERAGLTGPRRPRRTVPAPRPVRQVDHALGGKGVRVEKSWTVGTIASDHLPVVASILVTEDHQ